MLNKQQSWVDISQCECNKHTTHKLTPWPSDLLLKNPSLLDSCQRFPSNPSKQQETENRIPSEQPWKRKALTMETGKRGWGGLVLQLTLFSWASSARLFSSALWSERPPGDLRSQLCIVSQDEAIFNRFYEMSILTPRTGHRSSDCTSCGSEYPAWHWKTFRSDNSLYQPVFIGLLWSKAGQNEEKLESCENLTLKICFCVNILTVSTTESTAEKISNS